MSAVAAAGLVSLAGCGWVIDDKHMIPRSEVQTRYEALTGAEFPETARIVMRSSNGLYGVPGDIETFERVSCVLVRGVGRLPQPRETPLLTECPDVPPACRASAVARQLGDFDQWTLHAARCDGAGGAALFVRDQTGEAYLEVYNARAKRNSVEAS